MEDIVKEKYLTDIAYDCYNDRMAISSTTRKIHILEKNELEEWVEVASWDSQDVVLKLQWSVHEYNNLLISCGQDKQIIIWKEVERKFLPTSSIILFAYRSTHHTCTI